ncbi:MAG: hypothetical protein ACRD5J_19500 [Nitrososphaeraceae archaeon]
MTQIKYEYRKRNYGTMKKPAYESRINSHLTEPSGAILREGIFKLDDYGLEPNVHNGNQ